jgi:hypothetical protein
MPCSSLFYNKEIYKGITGIAELACVTKSFVYRNISFPLMSKLSVMVKAVASDHL